MASNSDRSLEIQIAADAVAKLIRNLEENPDSYKGDRASSVERELDDRLIGLSRITEDFRYKSKATMADILNITPEGKEKLFTEEGILSLRESVNAEVDLERSRLAHIEFEKVKVEVHKAVREVVENPDDNTHSRINQAADEIFGGYYFRRDTGIPTKTHNARAYSSGEIAYHPDMEEVLNLNEQEFNHMRQVEYKHKIDGEVARYNSAPSVSTGHRVLPKLVEELANINLAADPTLSLEDHKEAVMSDFAFSDEMFQEMARYGAVSQINRTATKYVEHEDKGGNVERHCGADDYAYEVYADNFARGESGLGEAFEVLGLDRENRDRAAEQAAGIDSHALDEFEARSEKLALSAEYPTTMQIFSAVGGDDGCQPLDRVSENGNPNHNSYVLRAVDAVGDAVGDLLTGGDSDDLDPKNVPIAPIGPAN